MKCMVLPLERKPLTSVWFFDDWWLPVAAVIVTFGDVIDGLLLRLHW
jgi:hypothetical protein